MKKLTQIFASLLSLVFLCTGSIFTGAKEAKAATVDDVFTSVNVYNEKGEALTEGLALWERFQIDANFAFNYGKVQPGDTTSISLPAQFILEDVDFEVKDKDGNLVATAAVNSNSKELTLTYTDYVLTKSRIEGKVHLIARVDHTVAKDKNSIPFYLTIGKNVIIEFGKIDFKGVPGQPEKPHTFIKSGWDNADDIKSITYCLNINQDGQELQNVQIADTLGFEGGEIDMNRFEIIKSRWIVDPSDNSFHLAKEREDVTAQYKVELSEDKRSFKLNLGNISADEGFSIRYRVKFPAAPLNGTQFPNDAVLKADNIEDQKSSAVVRYQHANGLANGDVYGVQVTKKDENGEPLEGAEFTLYDADGVTVVQTATSDSNGVASFSNLIKEHYVIKETKAPAGYQLSDEAIQVNAAQLDTYGSGVIYKDFTNRQALITASGTKTWVDDNNKAGKRPDKITVHLFANGTEVASKEVRPNEKGEWKYEFTDLPASSADGTDIVYSVTEDSVYDYTTTVDGMNIINTIIPSKPQAPGSSSSSSSSSSSTVVKKALPKTGENASWIMIAAGVALVGLVGFVVFRAKKK